MKIGLAHINLIPGDIEENVKKAIKIYKEAVQKGCDIVVYPELTTTGYVPGDLVEYNWFIKKNLEALRSFISIIGETAAVIGYIDFNTQGWGKPIKNAAAFIHKNKIIAKIYKKILPYSGIFYEQRYFETDNSKPKIINFKGKKMLITICADIWHNTDILPCCKLSPTSPLECSEKYDMIVNLSASPYHFGKIRKKINVLKKISYERKVNIVYVNMAGSNEQIVFDGTSFYVNFNGKIFNSKPFSEGLTIIDENSKNKTTNKIKEDISFLKNAIIIGIRDFFKKQNLEKAVIGVSGGIDSAVVSCLTVEAIGNNNVLGLALPSKFTSQQSIDDALELAKNLSINFKIIPINEIYNSYLKTLKLNDKNIDLTIQNIQARIRANILMSYSNRYGYILINTSNKSEIATGYSTMYGDSCGAISPIGDVLKTDVYKIAELINQKKEIIPQSIIKRIPTAELKPNQKDQDELPPYKLLDNVIKLYVEEKKDPQQIIKKLGNKEKIISIIKRIENNQYKRKQMPPIIKISKNSFDDERRIPIVKKINL
ncbi:MAG: NAD+ synthase [Elusimicrobiales bacterium]|nr:NAD+ synthase [Elusimicrobiales bacterium]